MNMAQHHLTDEEFTDLLAGGMPNHRCTAHLASCEGCRRELEAVGVTLSDFSTGTTTWADQQAPRRVPVPSAWSLRREYLPSWWAGAGAVAAAALLAVGLGYTPSRSTVAPAAQQLAMPPSSAELAADNRLMLSIDQELGYRTSSSTASTDREGARGMSSAVRPVAN